MPASPLAPLLDVQELDQTAAAVRKKSEALPERTLIPKLQSRITLAHEALQSIEAERVEQSRAEVALGEAVAKIVKEIEAADLERYSGKRKNRDEGAAHDQAQDARRNEKSTLEDQELELLESMEEVEARLAKHANEKEEHEAELRRVLGLIKEADASRDAELAGLATQRAAIENALPSQVVSAYERVRSGKASGGRGAALLENGSCTGCRIKLPSLEKTRMLDEPEDALIQCPQCRRVLVRNT